MSLYPWRVRCQLQQTCKFTIMVCDLKLTCCGSAHKWRGPTYNSGWLGETLAKRVSQNVVVLGKELINGLKMGYKKTTNYHTIWRACDMVRDWYLEGQRKSFHMIPALMERIAEVDPDAIVDWFTQSLGQ